MTYPLSGCADLAISMIGLKPETEDLVKDTVSRYTMPKDFCGTLRWAVYRICNALKSIFQSSDWQKTLKKIYCEGLSKACSSIYDPKSPSKTQVKINREIENAFDLRSREALEICLQMNTRLNATDDEVRDMMNSVSFDFLIKDIENRIKPCVENILKERHDAGYNAKWRHP